MADRAYIVGHFSRRERYRAARDGIPLPSCVSVVIPIALADWIQEVEAKRRICTSHRQRIDVADEALRVIKELVENLEGYQS